MRALFRRLRCHFHHKKYTRSTTAVNAHVSLRDGVRSTYASDAHKSIHRRLRTIIYKKDDILSTLMNNCYYIVEVAIDRRRRDKNINNLSIAVYYAGDATFNVRYPDAVPDWKDGVFYYIYHNGKLSRIAFRYPQKELSQYQLITVYQPDWRA